MTQVASPGNKYFNFCFIFMMTNNFQVYFLKYKAKPQTGTTKTFYLTFTHSHRILLQFADHWPGKCGLGGCGCGWEGEDFLGSTVMRPGLGEHWSWGQVLTPVSIHIYLGAGGGVGLRQRPQITALEPQAPELQVDRKWELVPPFRKKLPATPAVTVRVKTWPSAMIPGPASSPAPWQLG